MQRENTLIGPKSTMISLKHFSQILALAAIFQTPFICSGFTPNSVGQRALKHRTATLVPHPLFSPITAPTTRHAVLRKPFMPLELKKDGEESISVDTLEKNKGKTADLVKTHYSSDKNPFQEYLASIIPAHKNLAVSFMTVMIVLGTMIFNPLRANAVPSGGRVGGSFGGSGRSSSAPSTRMYSSPSNTYNRGYSRGYTSGYYSRPNVVITPPSPFFAPRPFFSPFWAPSYYGGPGVTVVSRGPNLFSFFALGGMLLFSSFVWNSMSSDIGESSNFGTSTMASTDSALGDGISVVKLSVAMSVPNRDDPNSILSVIDRLSRTAKTDSRMGVSNLMSQVSLDLLRRKDSIVAASSSYKKVRDPSNAQREFNSLSVSERSKFEMETISRFGGVDYGSKLDGVSSSSHDASKATMAVVTLLLNIDGDSTQVPKIHSMNDVTSALLRIASDVKVGECLRSAEILWTPEERSDVLSTREILADYPDLTTI